MTAVIFDHLWQSTVFAAAVALLSVAFRRNRARLRYGLWFAASLKFLVPFAALAAAGSLVTWNQAPAPIASVMTSPAIRGFNAPFAELSLDPAVLVSATEGPEWIARSLFAVWVCGFVGIALRRVLQWRRIRAAVRASTPWAAAARVPAGIRIRTGSTAFEPGVVGLRQPVILLPAGIDTYLTADQLAAVVAHEVCHARRRDNLTAAVHMLVEALFWFHPMVWWIGARLIAEREQACDEHVIAETAAPLAYAEGIVTVCKRYVETPLMSVAGVGGADIKARIDAILASRIGLRLTLPKRLVLATAFLVSLVVPLATGAIDAAVTTAQLPAPTAPGPPIDPETRFEVVSIKPFDASGGASPRISMTPGRYDFVGMPLRLMFGQALVVPLDRIVGLPEWIDRERYTIAAKAADPAAKAMVVMVANLLKDRFQMVTHRETRELPVYNLVFAHNDKRFGPAFKESSAECRAAIAARLGEIQRGGPVPTTAPGPKGCGSALINPGIASFSGVQMAVIAQILTQSVGRPVIDKTGLTSVYDYTLKWTPQVGSGMPAPFGLPPGQLDRFLGANGAPAAAADPDGPNLFTAVQEQLGLKLESARGPVEVIVVDRLEKPTLD
jgi:bla regulator protein BlaR1